MLISDLFCVLSFSLKSFNKPLKHLMDLTLATVGKPVAHYSFYITLGVGKFNIQFV